MFDVAVLMGCVLCHRQCKLCISSSAGYAPSEAEFWSIHYPVSLGTDLLVFSARVGLYFVMKFWEIPREMVLLLKVIPHTGCRKGYLFGNY